MSSLLISQIWDAIRIASQDLAEMSGKVYRQIFYDCRPCYREPWETDDDHAVSVSSTKRAMGAAMGRKLMKFADGKPRIFEIVWQQIYPHESIDGTLLRLRVYEVSPTDRVVEEMRISVFGSTNRVDYELDDCCSG